MKVTHLDQGFGGVVHHPRVHTSMRCVAVLFLSFPKTANGSLQVNTDLK